jgi:hypothetical protein
VVLALAALLIPLGATAHAGMHTVYKGQWLCDDRGSVSPLPGMNVELWKRGWDWLPVEISGSRVGQGFTDGEGRFSMSTPTDDDNYFVRMALRDAYGVHLKDFWGINDWSVDSGGSHNDVAVRDLGGLLLSKSGVSHKCAIWAGVHAAYDEFRALTGFEIASHGVDIEADAVTAGVPFSPDTSTWWPSDFPAGYGGPGDATITHHEFGHIIRHGFDGDLGHFLGDVVTYNYLQNHEPCNHTNAGYAFNEGWAEYWAGDYYGAPDCGRPGDMETEGNVAAALVSLAHECTHDERKPMVENLRSNPGAIHSFAEFKAHLGCPTPLLTIAPGFVTVAPLAPKPKPPAVTSSAAAHLLATEATIYGKKIKGLNTKLDQALHAADTPPPCVKRPCLTLLKTLTRPPGLRLQVTLDRIRLRTLKELDTAGEQAKFEQLSIGDQVKNEKKREKRDRKATINAALTATQKVLKAAQPVLHVDHSKLTQEFRHDMSKEAAAFGKAAHGGHMPASLTLTPATFTLPRKVPQLPAGSIPTPTPIPAPTFIDARPNSTLTIDECPAVFSPGKPIDVSGTLTPAVAGSQVKVSFSQAGTSVPGSEPVVTTDAKGIWEAKYEPPVQAGPWTVQASFAGDPSRKPSTSSPCNTSY